MVGSTLLWISVLAADLDVGAGQTYATINDAIDQAVAGDVVRVHPGTYVEDLSLGTGGADGSPIRIQAVRALAAVLQGTIEIDGDDWEVVGLTIETPPGADGIQISGARIVVDGIDLSGGTRDGIDGGGVDVTVRNSTIHAFDGGDTDAHCIVLNPGAERWVIEDNELFDCSGDGVQLYSAAAERTIIDTTIRRNRIYYTGAIMRTENAIDVKNADGLYIRSNVMWGFPDNKTLVFQKGPANIEVTCNEMSQGFTGVEFRGEDGGTIEGVVFAHNLMVGFTQYALKFDGTVGASVYNNTFVDIDGDGLRLEEQSLQEGLIRNNLWVTTTQVENDGDFLADHNGFWMVGDNQIASGSDVLADPMLDDEYRLMPGSPMIDAGVDVGFPFGGAVPDIGWDEVDGEPCEPAPEPPDDGGDNGDDASDDASDDAGADEGLDETGDGGSADAPGDGDGGSAAGSDGTGGPTDSGGASNGSASEGAGGCGCSSSPSRWGLMLLAPLFGAARRKRRPRTWYWVIRGIDRPAL